MADDIEQFNSHQEDVRRRADSLAKSIFVLAGGTLTVSIGIFTGSSAPVLTSVLSLILKVSWWGLFIAIVSFVLTLTVIIARDYRFGEKWRKQLSGHKIDGPGSPVMIEVVIWSLAILGLLAFLGGLLAQAYVASNVI